MSGTKKIVIGAALLLVAGAIWLYYGYLYKDARNIEAEESSYSVAATVIKNDYSTNQQAADAKYLNTTLEVKGKLTAVADHVITLDSTIFCSFDTPPPARVFNKNIIIKGRCIGFDELFEEVKLDQCTIIDHK